VRPLFIAKSYPPVIGGMERFSFDLAQSLQRIGDIELLANPRGAIAMPWFAPWSTAVSAWKARRRGVDLVHLGDALIAPFGVAIRRLGDVPVTVTVHGLDMTRETPPGYRRVVPPSVIRLDRVIAVSASTRDACLQRWPRLAERMTVIPNGVTVPEGEAPAHKLPPAIEARFVGRSVLLTVGRLVKRKGAAWFVANVLPKLPDHLIYVVAGEGPDQENLDRAIANAGQEARVLHLGFLSEADRDALYRRADVFVMPNIVVPNDVEGFGLVSLEAAVRETPVVAADLQGIPEAVRNDRNGFLVPPGDVDAFVAKLTALLTLSKEERRALGARFRAYTADNLSWQRSAQLYWQCFEEVVAGYRRNQ
jgi:glycosyltransferase involved in cell wall biosynthesis